MSSLPIADYALLSDCHSAALASRAGSVDWLCFPRFDSPAIFARLLDEEAGHWSIRPVAESTSTRRYLEGTLVLETRFETESGVAVLTDSLRPGPSPRARAVKPAEAGRHDLTRCPTRASPHTAISSVFISKIVVTSRMRSASQRFRHREWEITPT